MVAKLLTLAGECYLKKTPQSLYIEAPIILCLKKYGVKRIPDVMAFDAQRCCFTLSSCGNMSLHEFLSTKFSFKLLLKSIVTYKSCQISQSAAVTELLSLGVPDWRAIKLLEISAVLLTDSQGLKDLYDLSSDECNQLNALLPKLQRMLSEISQTTRLASLNHCDIHYKNIMIDSQSQELSVIDWGECVITDPYFSLLALSNLIKKRYYIIPNSILAHLLDTACFGLERNSDVTLVQALLPFYLLLADRRLLNATGISDITHTQRISNRIKQHFLVLIQNVESYE